jgi:G6PDH family F420-dependent oxidoreductase
MRIGYFLSCEEWGPNELVRLAVKAQRAGFDGLWISDHFHPWNDEQGHSPFVWSVIGALAQATERMNVTTAVTCPTMRIHPPSWRRPPRPRPFNWRAASRWESEAARR